MKRFIRILFGLLVLVTCLSSVPFTEMTLPPVIKNGAVVGTVIAHDDDPGQTLTYTIVSGNISSSFALNPTNGLLTIRNAAYIKSRTARSWDLIVRVTDSGGYDTKGKWVRLSAQATIRVTK